MKTEKLQKEFNGLMKQERGYKICKWSSIASLIVLGIATVMLAISGTINNRKIKRAYQEIQDKPYYAVTVAADEAQLREDIYTGAISISDAKKKMDNMGSQSYIREVAERNGDSELAQQTEKRLTPEIIAELSTLTATGASAIGALVGVDTTARKYNKHLRKIEKDPDYVEEEWND